MQKVSSNIASRLWTFLSQYPIAGGSEVINSLSKQRIKLLNNLAMMERDIIDIESILGGWSDTSIATAFYRYSKFVSLFDNLFVKNFNKFTSIYNKLVEKVPEEVIKEVIPEQNEELSIKQDSFIDYIMKIYSPEGLFPDVLPNLKSDEVKKAIKFFIKKMNKFPTDSIDREMVRDIIIFNRMDNPNDIEYKDLFLNKPKDKKEVIKVETEPTSDVSSIKKDIGFMPIILGLLKDVDVKEISTLWQSIFDVEDETIYPKYNTLLDKVNTIANTKLPNLEQIAEALSKINKNSDNQTLLEKVARKRLQRFLNKLRLNVSRNLESKRILDLNEKLSSLAKLMDHTQDWLEEKEFSFEAIKNNVKNIYGLLGEICNDLSDIAKEYNDSVGEHNIDSKKKLHIIRTTDIYLLKRRSEYFQQLSENA